MTEKNESYIIQSLRKRWIKYTLLSGILYSIGWTVLVSVLANRLFNISYWLLPLVFLAVFFLRHRSWNIKELTIAQWLNQSYPELEESSGLLLKDHASLNTLERLQRRKTEDILSGIKTPLPIMKKLSRSMFVLTILLLASVITYNRVHRFKTHLPAAVTKTGHDKSAATNIFPQVGDARITINPPAYTGKQKRVQNNFNLRIEEGSSITWELATSATVKKIELIFNDSLVVDLQATDNKNQLWKSGKITSVNGFYQLNIDGNLSELFKIETIRDQPPAIHIILPAPYTTIDFGEPQKAMIRVEISDDYGVMNASISTILSSGSGESVNFKERTIELPGFVAGKMQYRLQKLLSLPEFGMQPGDELYFFIKATDNHQESRSDMHTIILSDTATLLSLEGLVNGINLQPAYFRSQRQIIIETQQLLRDKDTISTELFKNRSNNLGIDQKLLRLRYGKFLGEEDESGEFDDSKDALRDPANFSNADKLKEAFTDQHDKAEDATFFEPETKKQLKATLNEMWKAELSLRTYKPQEALPYEFKALRLLKDLQQKTRAYVAKTNLKTSPLDLQKRLTGDLNKITEPKFQKDYEQKDDPENSIREALAILEQLKTTDSSRHNSSHTLQAANLLLTEKAFSQPSIYLPAVQALRRITNALSVQGEIKKADIILVEDGFQQFLSAPSPLPSAEKTSAGQRLSKQYFINLQRRQP